MTLIWDSEQEAIASTLRDALQTLAPVNELPTVLGTDRDVWRTPWQQLNNQLGLAGLAVPERFGGLGLGQVEVALACEELGAALTPVPFFSSVVLASSLLLLADDEEVRDRFLPTLSTGAAVGALAGAQTATGAWNPAATGVIAAQSDGAVTLSGTAFRVLSGEEATVFVVVARTTDGLGLFVVDQPKGVTRTPLAAIDLTRSQSTIVFDETPATQVRTDSVADALEQLLVRAVSALAAEQLGGMRACFTQLVDYLKVRVQFGRVVGSFQAVKHQLAELYILIEQAEPLVRHANWSIDNDPDEAAVAAATAEVFVGEHFAELAQRALLLHGGIGFTWEHTSHLYYKRAKTAQLMFGPTALQSDRLKEHLGL